MAAVAAQLNLSNLCPDSGTQSGPNTVTQHIEEPSVFQDLRSRSTTPIPPDEHELIVMRSRALAIRDGKGKDRETSLDNELVDMVLRLTALFPARGQLLDQAATIRRLSLQQDILLQRMDDEHARWEAEREGMRRVSEALIAQANIASHNLYKEQENSKKPALFESENVSLRQKLSDAQSRTSALESELAQLRPLLLMRPNALALSNGLILQPGKPRKKEGEGSNESKSYYRAREDKTPTHKSRKKKAASYFKHAPTASDARSEHLLLAARKLGKERATMVSQAMYRTADPHTPSLHVANDAATNSLITTVMWQNQQHLRQSVQMGQTVQQSGQQGQPPGNSSPSKVTQNTSVAQFGPPGMAFPHPQHYFMPPGTIARPGTAMPAPALFHAPRGYIPGPAWPYYSPAPYAFAIQNATPSSKPSSVRPANISSSSSPSSIPAQSTKGNFVPPTSQSSQKSNGTDVPSGQSPKASGEPKRGKEQKTPQSTSIASTATLNNPPTPMDSLLSAAHTVFSPSSSSGSHAADDIGSPSPKKRRRVNQPRGQPGANNDHNLSTASETPATPEKPTSALDVLADQAAGVVPSSQGLTKESEERDAEPFPTPDSQPESVVRRRGGPRKHKMAEETSISGTSSAPADKRSGSAGRKGKRPTRASSNASASWLSSASLVRPTVVPRAASEEQASSTASMSFQTSPGSFLLRPVQTTTFSHTEEGSAQSSSLPRSGTPAHRTNDSFGIESGRQASRRAVTPPLQSSTRQGRATPVDPDVDAEGDEVESEDADAEINRVEEDVPSYQENGSSKKRKKSVQPSGSATGRDVNSRRWLEILGRKES